MFSHRMDTHLKESEREGWGAEAEQRDMDTFIFHIALSKKGRVQPQSMTSIPTREGCIIKNRCVCACV